MTPGMWQLLLGLALAAGSCSRTVHGPVADELDVLGLSLGELQEEVDAHASEASSLAGRVDEREVEHRDASRQRIALMWDSLDRIQRCTDDASLGRFAHLAELLGRAHAETERHLAAAAAARTDEERQLEEGAHEQAMNALLDALWNQRERARARALRVGAKPCVRHAQ